MKKLSLLLLAAVMVVILTVSIASGALAAGDDYVYVPDPNNEWTGGVGFSQWSTAVSYSSIKVTNNVDGHILLDEEFDDPDLSGWNYFGRSNGDWDASNTDDWFVEDGSLIFDDYTKHGATIWTGDPNWGNYTVTVKGTVLDGEEGLCVFFCTKGPSDHYFFNIGGWSNTRAYAKWEVNGDIGNTDHVDCTLTYGQEYTVTIVVGPKGVSGYLEGEKLFELGEGGEANAETPAAATDEPAAPTFTYPASGAGDNIITGTVIGNATGWGDNADAGAAAAFDGNPGSFFDPLGVGDGFCGIDAGESYILDKVAVLSRSGFLDRFDGAKIEGSNDGENWTTLWTSDAQAASETEYTIITDFENNTGYSQFRYFNDKNHGDVAEVEFYGQPGAAETVPAESRGFADVNAAAAGRNVITGYEFVSGSEGFGGEGPENLFDGETGTKFCTGTFPAEAVAKLDGVYNLTGFTMATANDNADYNGRSPSDWTISVSSDGENWTELAKGDDSFFEETNFTYYAGEAAANGVSWVKFSAAGTASGTFQVSELTLFGDKDAAATDAATSAALSEKEEAPNTFDFGIAAAAAAVISLCGFAVTKKRK